MTTVQEVKLLVYYDVEFTNLCRLWTRSVMSLPASLYSSARTNKYRTLRRRPYLYSYCTAI